MSNVLFVLGVVGVIALICMTWFAGYYYGKSKISDGLITFVIDMISEIFDCSENR